MMRSMFSAVSGLRVHQTRTDVIANNVANVNTTGYKSSRVTFMDVFNQTLRGAARASGDSGRGGRNPMQVGLGANVASIDQMMSTGAAQRTDWMLDLMIEGDGFFIVGDNSGYYFTRNGAFKLDEWGNLTTHDGLMVNGWTRVMEDDPNSANYGTYVIKQGSVAPIVIDESMNSVRAETTSMVDFTGNLDAAASGDGYKSNLNFFDSVGNEYTVDVMFKYYPAGTDPATLPEGVAGFDAATGGWVMTIMEDADGNNCYLNSNKDKKYRLDMGFDGYVDPENPHELDELSNSILVAFDSKGNLVGQQPVEGDPDDSSKTIMLRVGRPGEDDQQLLPNAEFGREDGDGNFTGEVLLNMAALRQEKGTTSASGRSRDGMEAGELDEISIGEDGVITGIYTNGKTQQLAQIAITTFKNPAGLQKVGGSLFRETNNSGQFNGVGVAPGSNGTSIRAGALEMSNVDLSQEFTDMIITQRGFQANSRVITTSDEMLQELVNLKR